MQSHEEPQPRHQLSLEVKAARTGPGCSSLLLCWDEGHLLPDGHFGGTNVRPRGPGLVAQEGFVLGTGSAQGLEPRAAQGRPSLGCAPAPGAECSLQQLFCCPGPAGTSWWVLQGVSKPHCGQPRPLLPGQCCLYPLPVVGSSPVPPPCHQHGHQPGLCPKTSLPLPQPPFLSKVSPLLQRCGMEPAEQHWLHEAFRRGSPQAGTHRDSWDNLKTRAGT